MNRRAIERLVYPLSGVAVILLVWEAYTRIFGISRIVLPSPSEILLASIARYDLLFHETWPTFLESVYGFGLAVAIGIPLAVASRVPHSQPDALSGSGGDAVSAEGRHCAHHPGMVWAGH